MRSLFNPFKAHREWNLRQNCQRFQRKTLAALPSFQHTEFSVSARRSLHHDAKLSRHGVQLLCPFADQFWVRQGRVERIEIPTDFVGEIGVNGEQIGKGGRHVIYSWQAWQRQRRGARARDALLQLHSLSARAVELPFAPHRLVSQTIHRCETPRLFPSCRVRRQYG